MSVHDHTAWRRITRRALLAAAGGVIVPFRFTPAAEAAASREAIIARAFEMRDRAVRNGDQAFGAVVVKDGRIVGDGVSAVISSNDPTAHAEMQAIRDATRRLGTHDLSGAQLWSTFRPCPMCESAAHRANISRMYYGSDGTDAGAPRIAR